MLCLCIQVTPVYSSDGKRAILVRRGWVPDSWRSQHITEQYSTATRISGGQQNVNRAVKAGAGKSWWWFSRSNAAVQPQEEGRGGGVGVVTSGETANSLSFPNEPETGSWHWLDAAGVVLPTPPPCHVLHIETLNVACMRRVAASPRLIAAVLAHSMNSSCLERYSIAHTIS